MATIIKKIFLFTIFTVFSLLTIMTFASSLENYTISQNNFTLNISTSQDLSYIFTINNTGNQNLNLTLSTLNLAKGTIQIPITLNQTSIINLSPNNTTSISVSFRTTSNTGNFSGMINIVNPNNSTLNKQIPINISINSSNESLKIFQAVDTFVEINGEVGQTITKTIRVQNNGSFDFQSLSFTSNELRGINFNNRIRSSDIRFTSRTFPLNKGISEFVDIRVTIPSTITSDSYIGTFTATSSKGFIFTWNFNISVTQGNLNVYIKETGGDVKNGVLEINHDNTRGSKTYNFLVYNAGSINANNLQFSVDNDFSTTANHFMLKNSFKFTPETLNVNSKSTEIIGFRVQVPTTQTAGIYKGFINLKTPTGIELDRIPVKIKINGELEVSNITYSGDLNPGGNIQVKIGIKNLKNYKISNIKLIGELNSLSGSGTTQTDSSRVFSIDSKGTKVITLNYQIPRYVQNEDNPLVITITTNSETITSELNILIFKPNLEILINSFDASPKILSCDRNLYTFMKVENKGKYNENVAVSSEILNNKIKEKTPFFEIKTNSVINKNIVLDLTDLNIGEYTISQKVYYSENLFKKQNTKIKIEECQNQTGSPGIEIINGTSSQNPTLNQTNPNQISLFGTQVEKTSIYLGSGLVLIIALIAISLFLI